MQIKDVIDGSYVQLELSFEEVVRLSQACQAAADSLCGFEVSETLFGLPEGAEEAESSSLIELFSAYNTALEGIGLAMLCKGFLPYGTDVLDNFNVTALRTGRTAPEDLVPEESNGAI